MNSSDLRFDDAPRLLTGAVWADWTLGALFGLAGPLVMCFPPVIVFFLYRRRLPAFTRGVWIGMLTLLAILFFWLVWMFATHPHKFK